MKHLLHILLLLLTCTAWAQPATKCFKAYNQQGQEAKVLCAGQEYLFQDCGNQVPDENEYYVFDYKKGTPITNASDDQTHTYTTPGRYRVLQIANYGNNTLTDTVSVVFEVKGSPAPAFTTQSCANGIVSITITDSNYSSYTLNFGDGRQATGAKPGGKVQHRYSSPGTYTLTVSGSYTGGECTGEGTAEVITLPAAPTPVIRHLTVLEQANTGQLQLELTDLHPGFGYTVQRQQNNSYITIDTIRNVSQAAITHRLQNINTTEGAFYLVQPFDVCGSALQSSGAVSSIALEATAAEKQATLRWQSMPHAQRFEIYRNGALLRTLDSSIKSFTDKEVTCGQPYRYEVRGIASDGSISVSAIKEVQVVSTAVPAAPYLLSTYNQDNEVELRLELPQGEDARQLSFERSMSGGSFKALAQVPQALYTDAAASPAHLCYRASFTNTCGNTSSLSNASCPIYLQARKQDDGAAVSLEWTGYEGFPNGAGQYTVELLDESGNVVGSYPATGNTYTDRALHNDLQQLRYRVKATASNGTSTYSNTVLVERELQLYVPSGFTPNGDGLNDVFEVKGRFFSSYSIRVYNSLGSVVYEGTQADAGWDGTYKGSLMPAGAYVYEINAVSETGASRRRTGTITLLR